MDVYAATGSTASQRLCLAVALDRDWIVVPADVSTAFLHASLDTEMYVWPPDGMAAEGVVWRLRKALYGLRRAPQLFQRHLQGVLKELGFKQLKCDSTVFYHEEMEVLIDSHVDDMKVAGKEAQVDKIFEMLSEHLTIKREAEFGKD